MCVSVWRRVSSHIKYHCFESTPCLPLADKPLPCRLLPAAARTVLIFPVFILWNIRLTWRKKLALGSSLCLTVFVIAATVVRLAGMSNGSAIDSVWSVFWQFVAACVALVVNSATALRVLFVGGRSGRRDAKPVASPAVAGPAAAAAAVVRAKLGGAHGPNKRGGGGGGDVLADTLENGANDGSAGSGGGTDETASDTSTTLAASGTATAAAASDAAAAASMDAAWPLPAGPWQQRALRSEQQSQAHAGVSGTTTTTNTSSPWASSNHTATVVAAAPPWQQQEQHQHRSWPLRTHGRDDADTEEGDRMAESDDDGEEQSGGWRRRRRWWRWPGQPRLPDNIPRATITGLRTAIEGQGGDG